MPRGTTHTIEGTLRHTQLGYVIELTGGGHWILDLSARKARTMQDKQVIATGTRIDFNMLEVERIELADAPPEKPGGVEADRGKGAGTPWHKRMIAHGDDQ